MLNRKKSFLLSIENPCSENWETMSLDPKGKFCEKCQHVMIDFSSMSNQQVVKLLRESSGKICGRSVKGQFENTVTIYETAGWKLGSTSLVFSSLLLAAPFSMAQTATKSRVEKTANTVSPAKHGEKDTLDKSKAVTGIVFEKDTTNGLPGVTIQIDKHVGVTDIDGKFSIEISDSLWQKGFDIRSSYVDFKDTTIHVAGNFTSLYFQIGLEMTEQAEREMIYEIGGPWTIREVDAPRKDLFKRRKK